MLSQETIDRIKELHGNGMSGRKIAKELNVSRRSVDKFKRPGQGKCLRYGKDRMFLIEKGKEIEELFEACDGNCVVMRREIARIYGRDIPLRTLQRHCTPIRKACELKKKGASAGAGRFETAPGRQMQIDFGEKKLKVGGRRVKVQVFVGILGYSRRIFAKAYMNQVLPAWLNGIESAFEYFGGIPREIVSDNARTLVADHCARKEIRFTDDYDQFCREHGVKPVATGVRKPCSKGKVERAVRYVKENALAGNQEFESLEALNRWLGYWAENIADKREIRNLELGRKLTPKDRWLVEREEIRPLDGKRLAAIRNETRTVTKGGLIQVDNHYFRLNRRLAGLAVQIRIGDEDIEVKTDQGTVKLNKTRDEFKPRIQKESNGRAAAAAAVTAPSEQCGPAVPAAKPEEYDFVYGLTGQR